MLTDPTKYVPQGGNVIKYESINYKAAMGKFDNTWI